MTKKKVNDEAISRVQKLLFKHCLVEQYEFDEGFYDFDESYKPYYVWLDGEYHGVYDRQTYFCFKNKVNLIIKEQLSADHQNAWNHIYIFDVKKNKRVYPKL